MKIIKQIVNFLQRISIEFRCKRKIPLYNRREVEAFLESGVSYLSKQEQWLKIHNIKIGDSVMIANKAYTGENGWRNSWVDSMDACVGRIGTIINFAGISGIRIKIDQLRAFSFPYFVLVPSNDHVLKATITDPVATSLTIPLYIEGE